MPKKTAYMKTFAATGTREYMHYKLQVGFNQLELTSTIADIVYTMTPSAVDEKLLEVCQQNQLASFASFLPFVSPEASSFE